MTIFEDWALNCQYSKFMTINLKTIDFIRILIYILAFSPIYILNYYSITK